MIGSFETKAIEIAIGQVTGRIYPSDEERAAAYEILVEFATRTVTTPLSPLEGSIRDAMTSIYTMFETSREVLRRHGLGTSGGSTGNLSLALVTARVLNEVFRPVLTRWGPALATHEAAGHRHNPPVDKLEWERRWPHADACRADLVRLRTSARAYADTLARICGRPDLGDAAQMVPSSRPVTRTKLEGTWNAKNEVQPVSRMVGWVGLLNGVTNLLAMRRGRSSRVADKRRSAEQEAQPVAAQDVSDPAISYAPPAHEDEPEEQHNESEREEPSQRGAHHQHRDSWFDYVADLGDGFDPTMAVAWLLGRESLSLPLDRSHELPAPPVRLPRGRLLVLGGDQVYPYASRDAYERRTVLPYRHAWEGKGTADVVALPGNHDWMGGIDAFDEMFVQDDDSAPKNFADHWQVHQHRRYWHVELPHRWWLWGIDLGLDNTLDDAQKEYFAAAAEPMEEGGHRIIVCTPVPMWQLRQKHRAEYAELRDTLDGLANDYHATIPIWIAGDSHYFAHYENVEKPLGEDHITSGGGGAFLQPTHNAPARIPAESGSPEYVLTHRWPLPSDSRALAAHPNPWRDPQYLGAIILGALLHLLYGVLVGSDSGHVDSIRDSGAGRLGEAAATTMSSWIGWLLLAFVTACGALSVAANSHEPKLSSAAKKYGLLAGLGLAATLVITQIVLRTVVTDPGWPVSIVAALVGGVVSILVFFRFAVWINRRIRANDTLAFSPAGSDRFKHFVRFRIDPDGDLSCFVVGIDPVGQGWAEAMGANGLLPPTDPAGAPRIHYVWGASFPKFRPPPRRVTLSVSDGEGTNRDELEGLFEALCTSLINGGHWLLYGGLPGYGFTEQLRSLEIARHGDLPEHRRRLLNYVAPYQLTDREYASRIEAHGMKAIKLARSPDMKESKGLGEVRDLALMREEITSDAEIRIAVGGRIRPMSADGKPPALRRAPGVIEEAYLSVSRCVPVLILGGFGGCGELLAEAMLGHVDHRKVDEIAEHYPPIPRMTTFAEMMTHFTPDTWLRNGLTLSENRELLTTTDVEVAVVLVERAIERLATTPHLLD